MLDPSQWPDWTGVALLWGMALVPIVGFTKNRWPTRLVLLAVATLALYITYLALGGEDLAP